MHCTLFLGQIKKSGRIHHPSNFECLLQGSDVYARRKGSAGLEWRVQRGSGSPSRIEKSIFTRIALQMKIVMVVRICPHRNGRHAENAESYLQLPLGRKSETVTTILANSDKH